MSQGPVQIREPGGFESTPFGIIGLGDRAPAPVGEYAPAMAHQVEPEPPPEPIRNEAGRAAQRLTRAHAKHAEQAPLRDAKAGPREVVKAARARAKDIRAELRHHETLKRELAELERLIAAAKQKPESKLRALRAS